MKTTLFSLRPVALVAATLALAMAAICAHARTLETAYGPVEIEGQPERVVTLYEGALDTALAAGIKPLGAVSTRGGEGVANYLGDRASGIAIVGTARETNIEAVIAQQPDLILASSRLPQEQYQLLAQIAPTIVPAAQGFGPESWKEEARLFAKALGREAPIDKALEDIDNRSHSIREGHSAGGASVTLARWMPGGPMVMSTQLFSTGLLAACGLEVKDAGVVKAGRPHSDPLSLENLSRIDSDWLFLATLNADGKSALDEARESPAFARLEVVQRDQVVPVDGQLWTSASGPMAAQRVLDDIEAALSR